VALATVQQLIKDNEIETLRERRSVDRKPFVRPVSIAVGKNRDTVHEAFSRDISAIGIGLMSQVPFERGSLAVLSIHCPTRRSTRLIAETRWCQPYGQGWFLSGWSFIREFQA
jgi:hypothetical protein